MSTLQESVSKMDDFSAKLNKIFNAYQLSFFNNTQFVNDLEVVMLQAIRPIQELSDQINEIFSHNALSFALEEQFASLKEGLIAFSQEATYSFYSQIKDKIEVDKSLCERVLGEELVDTIPEDKNGKKSLNLSLFLQLITTLVNIYSVFFANTPPQQVTNNITIVEQKVCSPQEFADILEQAIALLNNKQQSTDQADCFEAKEADVPTAEVDTLAHHGSVPGYSNESESTAEEATEQRSSPSE